MAVTVRFYASLVDLARAREKVVPDGPRRSVKDVLESLGVPHPEIGLIVVDNEPVGFDHPILGGERIAAYPPWRRVALPGIRTVVPAPVAPRFVLDGHLGTLARRLRLLGFDSLYTRDAEDADLAATAAEQQRILLTRDRGLLCRREVVHGYCPRSDQPDEQLAEVVERYDLADLAAPFTRCVACNDHLEPVDVTVVAAQVPPRSRAAFDDFARCRGCGQVFWPGSHHDALRPQLAGLGVTPRHGDDPHTDTSTSPSQRSADP